MCFDLEINSINDIIDIYKQYNIKSYTDLMGHHIYVEFYYRVINDMYAVSYNFNDEPYEKYCDLHNNYHLYKLLEYYDEEKSILMPLDLDQIIVYLGISDVINIDYDLLKKAYHLYKIDVTGGLENLSIIELKELCKLKKINCFSKLRKHELIELLQ